MATGYNQPGAKRQKVREPRVDNDHFQGIDKMEYNNMASLADTSAYRYYSSSERVHSRPMEDWLKYSVSYTQFRNNGYDSHGKPHHTWDDGSNTVDNYKRCIKAFFDFCTKLGVKYWTAFDTDLVPMTDSWEENRVSWDDISEYVQDLMQRYHIKMLWLSPDLHSHPRYNSGAFTGHDATTYTQAATQIKKCLEMSQRLNAECFLLWPYKEGYNAIFQSDVAREIKLFAKLLKMTAEYKDRLNYRCQLLIMPYYNCHFSRNNGWLWQHRNRRENELVNMYMWDVTSCLYFLKNNNLDRFYKVCTLPGHHMFMANVYNMLGGVVITSDVDQYDSKSFTLMMKCVLDQGAPPPGGVILKLRARECSPREMLALHAKYVDAVAKALRLASALASEQTFSKHLQQRYSTFYSGFGSRLVTSDVTMEECEDYYKNHQSAQNDSSKYEQLDVMFQRFLDTCDHI
ncbi:xylose isomerase-like isoform X2 [Galleria mellonella]|uniref:Xylose isomerase n=1 Tax=Galleria mellonella TaxID=7137 RepID=A0ABM3N5R1_GALME|nr:xylose isomerase-like isoform X2 [Galleria mellonella]